MGRRDRETDASARNCTACERQDHLNVMLQTSHHQRPESTQVTKKLANTQEEMYQNHCRAAILCPAVINIIEILNQDAT